MTAARWRIALWVGTLAFLAYLVSRSMSALIPFFIGATLAYALAPVVDRITAAIPLDPKHETTRRGLAVAVVYLVSGVLFAWALSQLVPVLLDQVTNFISTMPERIEAARSEVNYVLEEYRRRVPEDTRVVIDENVSRAGNELSGAVADTARNTAAFLTGTVSILFGYLIVPFWMFYAMRDRHAVHRSFMRAVPPGLREDVLHAFGMFDHLLGRYIRAQLTLGIVVGLAVGIGLTLLDVQLSIGLGVWAGVTELVPILGPWLGAIPGLLIVLGTEPELLPFVAILYFAVQQLENNFLVPRVQGEATDIPAVLVIVLLVVGGAAFGFAGIVVIVPLTAVLRELFWYTDRRLRGASPEAAFEESRAARTARREALKEPGRLTRAWQSLLARAR